MALDSDKSIMVGLATATVVYGLYQVALPNVADVRSLDTQNQDVQAAERLATWTAGGIVAGIALLSKDMTVFIIGAGTVVGMAWWHRHANEVSPLTGKARGISPSDLIPPTTQEQAPTNYQQAPSYDATVM